MDGKNVEPYTKVLNKILDDTELTSNEKILLISIISYYNEHEGYAYPSYKDLKKRSSLKKDMTLIKHSNSLEQKGYITKETTTGVGCKYFINKNLVPTPKREYLQKGSTSEKGVTPTPKREEHPPQKGGTTITNTITKKITIYDEVVDYLNKVLGTNYKAATKVTKKLIKARHEEGFKFDDFKCVIDNQHKLWINNSKMCEFLRPTTLFSNNFESYLNKAKNFNNTNENKTSSASYQKVDESKLILPGGFKKNE